jgi:hypothetical protein
MIITSRIRRLSVDCDSGRYNMNVCQELIMAGRLGSNTPNVGLASLEQKTVELTLLVSAQISTLERFGCAGAIVLSFARHHRPLHSNHVFRRPTV